MAVNEDNKDDQVFTDLAKGKYRICYASPELLLQNPRFKQLFRTKEFRRKVVAMVVDEAHVIESWKDEFRKDYGELESLKIIAGTEIPWLALTATCSTKTFEIIYQTLGMGSRPFYGIDLGADRPNLAQWVRPMEYPASSLMDLLAFVPVSPQNPSDFEKTIFYLKTRQLTRRVCDLCRYVVAPKYRKCMYSFTAVNSEDFKDKVIDLLRDGSEVRWIFATIAAGMGTDIPDISKTVIFGVDPFNEAFQKGGRAGRSENMKATMIWLVEPWVFENTVSSDHTNVNIPPTNIPPTKKVLANAARRANVDPASREYINRSQSPKCMREFSATHFRPNPNLPGFPAFKDPDPDSFDTGTDDAFKPSITWEVIEQPIATGGSCGCSAACCRKDPNIPVGLLSNLEREAIKHHLQILQRIRPELVSSLELEEPPLTNTSDSDSMPVDGTILHAQTRPALPALRCSKPERENLREALISWHDQYWANVRSRYPFLSREWIITNKNINLLVDKAHLLLNQPTLDVNFVKGIIRTMSDNTILSSLLSILEAFCTARRERDAQEALDKQPKRAYRRRQNSDSENINPHPLPLEPSGSRTLQWQLENYLHPSR